MFDPKFVQQLNLLYIGATKSKQERQRLQQIMTEEYDKDHTMKADPIINAPSDNANRPDIRPHEEKNIDPAALNIKVIPNPSFEDEVAKFEVDRDNKLPSPPSSSQSLYDGISSAIIDAPRQISPNFQYLTDPTIPELSDVTEKQREARILWIERLFYRAARWAGGFECDQFGASERELVNCYQELLSRGPKEQS